MTLASAPSHPLQKVPLSPEPLYRLLFGLPMTQILLTALDLGLFERLHRAPATLDQICQTLKAPIHSGEMLVNTCVALGLLQKEDQTYRLSALSENYLVQGQPFFLGGLIGHFRAQVFPAWGKLKDAILEDGPQMVPASQNGKTNIFEVTQQKDRETELFIAAMHNLSVSDGLILADSFDFSSFRALLDVGGGSGALSLAIASQYPLIKATVWDRPQVTSIADRYIREAGLDARVDSCGGDAFQDAVPAGRDVILISLFIHAFGLERCFPLLQKCFAALPPGGCLLIYEPMLEPQRTGPLTTLLSSLNMLVVTPSGGDTTPDDYRAWLTRAGFERTFYRPAPAIRHLVGGYKPPLTLH